MDQAEFRRLALLEIDSVYRLAYHLAPNRNEVDDLVQETFFRALKSAEEFQLAPFGLRPYLFKILHNLVCARASRAQRDPESLSGGHDPAAAELNNSSDCSDMSSINWENIDERLKRAIAGLSLEHRTVFLLCAVEELQYREIAEIVDVPIGTVMSRLYNARKTLALRLTDMASEQRLKNRKNTGNNESTGSV